MVAAKESGGHSGANGKNPCASHVLEVFLFTMRDELDRERALCFKVGEEMIPLFATDVASVSRLRDLARHLAVSSQKPVSLLRFSRPEQVEVIAP